MDLYRELLEQLMQFRTISFSSRYIPEIEKAVAWYKTLLQKHGFVVKIVRGYDNPIIFCSREINKNYPTVLIYGHYDVQPADKADGWDSEPFQLTQSKNRLYGRGVIDNKGQHLVHLATILELIKSQRLLYNIKFFIEGNEETGSPNIGKFFRDYRRELKADFIMISDGEQIAGHPNINAGYRGITNCTVILRTAKTDLHSGIYGGAAPNAAWELCKLLCTIFDSKFRVKIPGFYRDIQPVSPEIRKANKQIPFSIARYRKMTGNKTVLLPGNTDFYSRVSMQPAIEISGIGSGYTGPGFKSIIPGEASAKINFRIVPGQKPEIILNQFAGYLKNSAPRYVDLTIENPSGSEGSVEAVRINIDNKYVSKAKTLLAGIYGKSVFITHHGATLPMVASLDKILQIPIVDVPLVNEDCNMHGANENYDLGYLQKARKFSRQFFSSR